MHFILNQRSPAEYRYEIKFVFSRADRRAVAQKIKTNPALFSEIFFPRWVNNIYYDTPVLGAYYSTINGFSPRVKVRIRWYGNLFGNINPTLEFKLKRSNKNTKVSFGLIPIEIASKMSLFQLKRGILENKSLPHEIKNIMKLLRPTAITRFLRGYYLSEDKKFRITIDSKLGFASLLRTHNFSNIKPAPDGLVIVEIKFAADCKGASRITNDFASRFQLSRMSKYSMGLEW